MQNYYFLVTTKDYITAAPCKLQKMFELLGISSIYLLIKMYNQATGNDREGHVNYNQAFKIIPEPISMMTLFRDLEMSGFSGKLFCNELRVLLD